MEFEVRPIAELAEHHRVRAGTSVREIAKKAAISEGRWRQIVKGYQSARGIKIPVNAPDETLFRMARAAGVTADEAEVVDEPAVAEMLRHETVSRLRHPSMLADGDQPNALATYSDGDLLREIERRLEIAVELRKAELDRILALPSVSDPSASMFELASDPRSGIDETDEYRGDDPA